MKIKKIALLVLVVLIGLVSCKKDDDTVEPVVIEIRDRAEQQVADSISIVEYLKEHYYNSSELAAMENPSIQDIIITKLSTATVPDGSTLLMNAVEKKTTNYVDTAYEYYVLRLNQGGGSNAPKFSDTVIATYEGFTLNGNVFDSTALPGIHDLVGNATNENSGRIKGWKLVMPLFNVAESFTEAGDGTIDYDNYGLGVMFLPSGLAYFSSTLTSIPAYTPISFKFELLQMYQNDHDGDGVPSSLEDINKNGELITVDFLADDDTDGDGAPDYLDADDDGDGVLTINEDLEDTDLTVDSDGDGIKDNDRNGDGDPTNDDTDKDGIPNYLDKDDKVSKQQL